jgi:flagellar biosynthetic protein FlhB
MAEDVADRTEAPTPRRREDARKHGQVALSPEVSPVAVLFTALALAAMGGPMLLDRSRAMLRAWLAAVGPLAAHDDPAGPLLARTVLDLAAVLVPFLLGCAAVGTAAVVAQVGFQVTTELLVPDPSRVFNLAAGAKRIFSANGAMNLAKAVAKIAIVGLVSWAVIRAGFAAAVATPAMNPEQLLGLTAEELRALLWRMGLALAGLGALDWLWTRWRHERSLKMSRQEVKEEQKQSEGDPQVRMRFRRAHRELAKRRMLAEVPRADVVLTNPIHFAVALRWRPAEMAAPRVVAKGAGELARRIKDAARQAGVPIVERRALARALYRTVEVGAEIPPALYRAVAEILAYIYSLRGTSPREAR